MTDQICKLIKDESGATAVEYGLIAALISVACVSALIGYGNVFANVFTTAGTAIGG